jgi:hypothetical protein
MSRRLLFAAVLVAVFLVSFLFGGVLGMDPNPSPAPSAPTSTATPADPLAWYKSLPTATPGCPKTATESEKSFYRQCQGARK